MSVEDSESRRFELTFCLSFSQADLGPNPPRTFFFVFFFKFETFFRRFVLIASGTEIFWRVSLKFELSGATSRFHCHRFNKRPDLPELSYCCSAAVGSANTTIPPIGSSKTTPQQKNTKSHRSCLLEGACDHHRYVHDARSLRIWSTEYQ